MICWCSLKLNALAVEILLPLCVLRESIVGAYQLNQMPLELHLVLGDHVLGIRYNVSEIASTEIFGLPALGERIVQQMELGPGLTILTEDVLNHVLLGVLLHRRGERNES